MNNKPYFIIILVLACLSLRSQTNYRPASAVKTGIFYDLVAPLSGIQQFDGTENSPPNTLKNWKQIYFELSNASLSKDDFRSLTEISKDAKIHIRNEVIPIAVLGYEYNFLGDDLSKYVGADGIINLSGIKVPEYKAFASAPFKTETFHGNNVVFSLPEELIFTNFSSQPKLFQVNFDDNYGWRKIATNENVKVSYQTTGKKIIRLTAVFEENQVMNSAFYFDVKNTDAPQPSVIWNVQGEIPYQGITTTGDAYIFLAEGHATVEKPIILSEGIDFEDNLSWDVLYDLYNQQNMLEDLRAEGFDMIIFNYLDPTNYIQSNGLLMVKLIEMINDTTGYSYPVAVVGPSMGGLVCRYALAYMEANSMNHNANLYFSFDAPHQGANIPLGLQYLVNFYKDLDAVIQQMLDVLNQPAARQMLVYHYTDPASATAGHDELFDSFYNELNTLGYPQNTRNIALSNGRADGVGQPYNAGDQVIKYEYSTPFLITLKGNVWAVNNNASNKIMDGRLYILGVMNKTQSVTVFSPKPYDNAPGGDRATFSDMDSIQAPYGDIIALQESHCFVPTTSALDYAETNLFFNIAADPLVMEKTPFDTIRWENDNYEHVYISEGTATFAMNEIMQSRPAEQFIPLKTGWNDLSSYLDPLVKEPSAIADQLGEDFIILQHFNEVYWPAGGINTLTHWEFGKGYVIKVLADTSLTLTGNPPSTKSIQITAGWNMISVLSDAPKTITEVLGTNQGYVDVIKEAVGFLVFWPEAGISTLQILQPGKSYYLHANQDFILNY